MLSGDMLEILVTYVESMEQVYTGTSMISHANDVAVTACLRRTSNQHVPYNSVNCCFRQGQELSHVWSWRTLGSGWTDTHGDEVDSRQHSAVMKVQ